MFVSELFDQFRDLLSDALDTQVPFATKKLYLNRGIARLWPAIGRYVSDVSIAVVAGQYEYELPASILDGMLYAVELENLDGSFSRFDHYDVIFGDATLTGVLLLLSPLPPVGRDLRLRYSAPISLIAAADYEEAETEDWTGPERTVGLPVLYAMGMASVRKLDDRQDTLRYSTTQAANGTSDLDIMNAAQMWFAQFEAELAQMERPLPPARD
jgi:hypothetical protein